MNKLFKRLKCLLTNHKYDGKLMIQYDFDPFSIYYKWKCSKCGEFITTKGQFTKES